MRTTLRIERLLHALATRGHWTAEEEREVKEIISMSDDPLVPRRKPFEIDGDWDEPGTKKYDRTSVEELRLDESPLPPARPAPLSRPEVPPDRPTSSLEERVAYLERMNQLLWKVVHQMKGEAPQDPEER